MVVFGIRAAPKNQTASFQMGPPNVASYVGNRSCVRAVSGDKGVLACQASLFSVTRTEPLNVLPPDFVIVLMMPPWKRPNSAEMPDVDVVVSWTASSMKRLFGVPRMLSVMTAPLTV